MGRLLNLTGQRFGRLIATTLNHERSSSGQARWDCVCDCGGVKTVLANQLVRGLCSSCGCLERENRLKNVATDKLNLAGKKFGRLTCLHVSGKTKAGKAVWHCKCDCGNEHDAVGSSIQNGNTRSCGCLKDEVGAHRFMTHGATKGRKVTHEYSVNQAVRRRCSDQKHRDYPYYGGRGISYDPRWDDHAAFMADMGPAPTPDHTIERRDRNGNYNAENCYWATRKVQANNTSRNREITINGETKTMAQWCEHYAVPYSRVRNRLNTLGWTVDEAFFTGKSGNGGRPRKVAE